MHSSRMRTAHSLTASRSISRGALHAQGCVCAKGHACWRVDMGGDACPGWCMPMGHVCHAQFPVNRMTDTCENITLLQTSFVGGKNT